MKFKIVLKVKDFDGDYVYYLTHFFYDFCFCSEKAAEVRFKKRFNGILKLNEVFVSVGRCFYYTIVKENK